MNIDCDRQAEDQYAASSQSNQRIISFREMEYYFESCNIINMGRLHNQIVCAQHGPPLQSYTQKKLL